MIEGRYAVVQAPLSGAWTHYFRAWYGDVPAWDRQRDLALAFDVETARQLVGRFNNRYRCPTSGLHHYAEALP